MKFIPAIDLKNNKVVLATSSKRSDYKEISKLLAPSSDPLDFIDYLLTKHHFNTIYLADLDSIDNFYRHSKSIEKILRNFNNIHFLIDNGINKCQEFNQYNSDNYTQIIGTESFADYEGLKKSSIKYILSLDLMDNKVIALNSGYNTLKPKQIICMSLDNIGVRCGPNYGDIINTQKLYPSSEIIVSGGIKDNKDIDSLKKNGLKKVILLTSRLENKIDFS